MKFIENAKFGEKVLFVGKVAPCPGQKLETIMKIAEKAYIRHFLANGHDLANKSGIRMMEHEINSEGKVYKSFIPSRMYLNK